MQRPGVKELFLGVFILFLSVITWKLTENQIAWFVMFVPGAIYVIVGLYKAVYLDLF